ncbi:MAG: NAD(P)/FAD-dependent oxidoreductase [Bacteriovoracaceae bacterium]|nr:NAD(P)/FAD-dependent oxidoreductase [Bacteriovoracaceae bacterium]
MKIYDVAVIGGGSAGTMAALRVVLNNDECLFFPGSSKDKKKSRAFWVTKVENMPAHLDYKKGIEEPNKESLDWLSNGPFKEKFIWKKNTGITYLSKNEEGLFVLTDNKNETYRARFVILCTGVMDVQPEILGSIEPIYPYANVQLADYCLRCDGHHVLNKKIAVIGHNTSAAWIAVMLFERYQCPEVTIVTNGKEPDFDDEIKALIQKYNFKIETKAITELVGEPKNNKLEALICQSSRVEADYIFIALGMIVYNDLAKMVNANLDQRGFVVTDNKGQSSIQGLYIAGDLRASTKKQIYTAWDTAVDSADEINVLIRRKKRITT